VRTSAFRLPSCLYEKRGGSVGEWRGGGGGGGGGGDAQVLPRGVRRWVVASGTLLPLITKVRCHITHHKM